MRAIIVSALASLNLPIYWITWDGEGEPPAQYIAYYYREKDTHFAGNHSLSTHVTAYVDFLSATDDDAKCVALKAAMRAAGFVLVDDMPTYDSTTKTWYLATVWNYVGVD
jgi:hypothetical protein